MNERTEAHDALAEIFSRKMKVGAIGTVAAERQIEANAAERAALAAEFDLQAIASLTGFFTLTSAASAGGVIEATLDLAAEVTQICVVSLEPFEAKITETAKLRFIPVTALREDVRHRPPSTRRPWKVRMSCLMPAMSSISAPLWPSSWRWRSIPYPRKPGAELPPSLPVAASDNPFAILAARKNLAANDPE